MHNKVLQPNHYYRIKSISQQLDRSYSHKLLSMGMIPGATLQVIRFAPLGDTLQIEVNGFSLSLRAKELQQIVFEKVES